jgi:hypothetical protein
MIVKQTLQTVGGGMVVTGVFMLGVMTVVGTISVDLALLAWVMQESENNHRHHHRHDDHSFLTGVLVGQMFSGSHHHYHRSDSIDLTLLFLGSLATSIAAVVLSFCLGVPYIGLMLIAGWTVSADACTSPK